MKTLTQLTAVVMCAAALTACSDVNNELVGGVAGGVLGGALGSTIGHGNGRAVAIIGGSLIGTVLGSRVGRSMDEVDKMKLNSALESTPTGTKYTWRNPDNGTTYTVEPTKTETADNRVCRDFTTSANIDGRYETVKGRACRNNKGQWVMVT